MKSSSVPPKVLYQGKLDVLKCISEPKLKIIVIFNICYHFTSLSKTSYFNNFILKIWSVSENLEKSCIWFRNTFPLCKIPSFLKIGVRIQSPLESMWLGTNQKSHRPMSKWELLHSSGFLSPALLPFLGDNATECLLAGAEQKHVWFVLHVLVTCQQQGW